MRIARTIALVVALAGVAWTIALIALGGFDLTVFGRTLTAHDPMRPLLVASVLLAGYVLLGGTLRMPPRVAELFGRTRLNTYRVALILAALTAAVGLRFGTMAIGGSDSYGYVSEADLWLAGNLKVSQPWVANAPWPAASWTFAPLAYRPVDDGNPREIVPTYAPGLPLFMAAAKLIGGTSAVFAIVPLFGGVMVLATFGIGRRLGSATTGLIAAWLVATSPVFLFMLVVPMSDVVASSLWAAAFCCLLGSSRRSSVAAGLLSALAILTRPNLFPAAAVFGAWFLIRAWQTTAEERRGFLWQGAIYAVSVVPGIVAIAAINRWLYGSPAVSGYGGLSDQFAWANVWPNFLTYARWFVDSQTPLALIGVVAIVVPLRRFWPSTPNRSVFVIGGLFVATIIAEYCAYKVVDPAWSGRLLLPCWPFVMLGLASVARAGLGSGRPLLILAAVCGVVLLGVHGARVASDRGVFALWKEDHRFPAAAALVEAMTDRNSVVVSKLHSGSVRYYAGRMTLRYDTLDPAWLDGAVDWLGMHGVHVYALLEEWEVPEMKARFVGQHKLAALDAPPLFVYRWPSKIYCYDLLTPVNAAVPARVVVETFRGPRVFPPAPAPVLVFKD